MAVRSLNSPVTMMVAGGGREVLAGLFGSAGQRALEGRLSQVIAQRDVYSDEVANVDTPGYTSTQAASFATTLEASINSQLGGGPPSPTGPAGAVAPVPPVALAAPGGTVALAATSGSAAVINGTAGAVTPDGNAVDFDALMVNLAENDLTYQAISRQLQLTYTNLGDAIDSGGS